MREKKGFGGSVDTEGETELFPAVDNRPPMPFSRLFIPPMQINFTEGVKVRDQGTEDSAVACACATAVEIRWGVMGKPGVAVDAGVLYAVGKGTNIRRHLELLKETGWISNAIKVPPGARKRALIQGFPLIASLRVPDTFGMPETRYTHVVAPTEAVGYDHTVVVAGYNIFQGVMYCINSHGTDWGNKGGFDLGLEYIESDLLTDVWTVEVKPKEVEEDK